MNLPQSIFRHLGDKPEQVRLNFPLFASFGDVFGLNWIKNNISDLKLGIRSSHIKRRRGAWHGDAPRHRLWPNAENPAGCKPAWC